MQSSSAARAALAIAVITLSASYLPVFLTPDALAQTILPSPNIVSVLNSAPAVQTSATSTAIKARIAPAAVNSAAETYPRLVVPSIGLNDPIVPVGVDSTGAMAVPSGSTKNVGWYDGGPQLGGVGSAVLDAHVFAAFTKLDELKTGDEIYVQENGQTLEFVVTAVKTYSLSQITSQDLFTPTTDRDLNLITCAGQLIDNNSTYNERLVVYSTLVN